MHVAFGISCRGRGVSQDDDWMGAFNPKTDVWGGWQGARNVEGGRGTGVRCSL